MEATTLGIGVAVGAAMVGPGAVLWARSRFETERLRAVTEAARAEEAVASRDLTIQALRREMDESRAAMDKAFGEASEKALNEATGRFLELARGQFEGEQVRAKERSQGEQVALKELLEPMHKELEALEKLTHETGKQSAERMGELRAQVESVSRTGEALVNALKKPQVRGSWGEGQLIAILESSGWTRGQNFEVQDSTEADGKTLRTDVVVTLPRGRQIVIDCKVPLDSYLAATEATTEEERVRKLGDHARAVRGHVRSLSSKDYSSRYPGSPPYVILFLPYEAAYQIACEQDKTLLDDAHRSRIILANPMTLMNLIHLATYVLNEERLQQNAEEVRAHAKELCDRLGKAVEIVARHGRHLRIAAESYNDLVGSVSGRLLPSAHRMRELGAGSANPVVVPQPLDVAVRHLVVTEEPTVALPG
jgi:DNA recombination protein RmuC